MVLALVAAPAAPVTPARPGPSISTLIPVRREARGRTELRDQSARCWLAPLLQCPAAGVSADQREPHGDGCQGGCAVGRRGHHRPPRRASVRESDAGPRSRPKGVGLMNTSRADRWRSRGSYFSWRPAEDASSVEIFHVEMGDPGAPVLLLIHGAPTSSIDWSEVASQLSARFRVCAVDFPGFGFSDKPQGWGYSLTRDEELIEFYLSEVIGAEAGVVV